MKDDSHAHEGHNFHAVKDVMLLGICNAVFSIDMYLGLAAEPASACIESDRL